MGDSMRYKKNIIIDTVDDLFTYYKPSSLETVDWYFVNDNFVLTENFIEQHIFKIWNHYFNFKYDIAIQQELSIEFIDKHIEKFDLYHICRFQQLTPEFIVKYADKIDYYWLLLNPDTDWKAIESKGADVIVKMYNYNEDREGDWW